MKHVKKMLLIAGSLLLAFTSSNFAKQVTKADSTPVTYERMEYLQTDGNAYFDTGLKINSDNFKIEMIASCSDTSENSNILFALNNSTSNSFWVGSKSGYWVAGGEKGEASSISSKDKALISFTRTYEISTIIIRQGNKEGTAQTSKAAGNIPSDPNDNCYLLNGKRGSDGNYAYPFKGSLYSCKCFVGGQLVRDFVPVKSSNNEYGLYDLMASTFHENKKSDGSVTASGDSFGDVNKKGYKRVEYISSTKEGKQVLDTGIKLQDDTDLKYKFEITASCDDDTTSYSNVLLAFNGNASTSRWAGSFSSNWALGPSKALEKSSLTKSNLVVERTFDGTTGTTKLTVDEASVSENGKLSMESSTHLFGEAINPHPFYGKLYACKIYENDKLLRDYIPVKDTILDLYGLFDLVTGTFNAGTYNFTGGNVVDNIQASLNFSYDDTHVFTFANGINLTTKWSIPSTIYANENYGIKLGYQISSSVESFASIDKAKGTKDGDNYTFYFSFKKIPYDDRDKNVKVTIYVYDLNTNRTLYSLFLNNGDGHSVKSMASKYVEMYNADNTKYQNDIGPHLDVLKHLADIA